MDRDLETGYERRTWSSRRQESGRLRGGEGEGKREPLFQVVEAWAHEPGVPDVEDQAKGGGQGFPSLERPIAVI